MEYLTIEEFLEMGFDDVEDFYAMAIKASLLINLYIRNFYSYTDFESDVAPRKQAVKQAVAFQVAYMESSGMTSAEDKQNIASMSVGRTSVSYGTQNGSSVTRPGASYGLCLDAVNALRGVGFDSIEVTYDR